MLAAEFPSGVQVVALNQVWEIVISVHTGIVTGNHTAMVTITFTLRPGRSLLKPSYSVLHNGCRLPFLLLIENINIDQNSQWLRPLSNFLVIHFEHVFLPAI